MIFYVFKIIENVKLHNWPWIKLIYHTNILICWV